MVAAIIALLGTLLVAKVSSAPSANITLLTPLPESADEMDIMFQPILDFDRDGCYNTAAVSPDGDINPGEGSTITIEGHCRDPRLLVNSNAYSRRRCNNGICAIMYEYYFQKDQALGGSFLGGHRHDWENIIVFLQGDQVIRVAPACHGGYDQATSEFLSEGFNPLLVYHKDAPHTHCFRLAVEDDLERVESDFGVFYRSPLVGWDHWPDPALRDTMLQAWKKGVGPNLDDEFGRSLWKAAGDQVPGFDPYLDE